MFVTPLFAAVFGLLYVLLAIYVIRLRIRSKVAYGDNGDKALIKAIRIHANFAEYVPFTLLLLWLLESMTFATPQAFWLGSLLLIGRVLHVMGMAYPKTMMICRQIGMLATFAVILLASVLLLLHYMPVSI